MDTNKRICPEERAGGLDNIVRKWLQNPKRILGPYIKEGMTVADFGCGPGLFSIEMARMVGADGRVFACDMQDGMLERLRAKIRKTDLAKRIILHKCEQDNIGIQEKADLLLAFYVVHEVPDQEKFFKEAASLIRPNGLLFIIEPPFYVSKEEFMRSVMKAQSAGFEIIERPRVFMSKAVIMKNAYQDRPN